MAKVPAFAKVFAGRWRIIEMDVWDNDVLDIGEEPHLTFKGASDGEIAFVAVKGSPRSPLGTGGRLALHADALGTALTRAFDDGRLALDNNPAERALRGVSVGRKNYLFAGSDRGADRAAALYSLIETAKLNGLNPEAHLRDVLARIADHPAQRLGNLLPWNWLPLHSVAQTAA